MFENLVNMAQKQTDDLSTFVPANKNMASAIAAVMAQEEERKAFAAASEVVKLMNRADTAIANIVTEIRSIRKREEDLLAELKNINRAKAYAKDTDNYVPLMRSVGVYVNAGDAVSKVPESYKTPEEREAKPVKAGKAKPAKK